MFEQGPSEEDRKNALREKIAHLEQQQEEINFYMENRESDSYHVAGNDAERLATIKKELEEAMAALGESPAPKKREDVKRQEAA